jgi:hypothetical protein
MTQTEDNRKEAQRILMRQLRERRAELGVREKRVLVHDEDWPEVRKHAERLLRLRLINLTEEEPQ